MTRSHSVRPCCPGPTGPQGDTGAQGAAGPQGAKGAAGNDGCCQIGLRPIQVAGALVNVTPAMLMNPSRPGATYLALRFEGGDAQIQPFVALPKPASLDLSYEIILWNKSRTILSVGNDVSMSGDTLVLDMFLVNEIDLESEIGVFISTVGRATTYRTQVLVTPEGVYRVPGFTDDIVQPPG